MQREKYVDRFCVLLFLIIDVANVNALILASCDDPLENEVCNLTCTTTNHTLNVAFTKEPDLSIIAQCDKDLGCSGTNQFSISQPDSVTTVLSFIHSRNSSGTWICSYGLTPTSVPVPWATYPQHVSTTLTSNTTVDTNIDGNVTLWCLYSEQAPTVTLQYEDANGNNDVMSAERFQCDATDIPCTDVNFTTYECPVVVKKVTGIGNYDTYSIKLKINVSHVETDDVHTIVTGITFKSSGGTNTSTDNADGEDIGILTGCLVIAYIIVNVMAASVNCCFKCCQSTTEQIVTSSATESSQTEQSFTSSGRESSQEGEGDPGFFKDKVLTLKSLLIFGCLVFYGAIVEAIVLFAVNKLQEELVIGVGFAIVLVLSGLCLLVVVWMLMKFVNNEKPKCEEQPDNSKIMMTEKDTT